MICEGGGTFKGEGKWGDCLFSDERVGGVMIDIRIDWDVGYIDKCF